MPPTAARKSEVLVVSGEASGDRIAAMVAEALRGRATLWGLTGQAGRQAGIASVGDTSSAGVMGLWDALGPMPTLALALTRLARRASRRRPRAALLISYTEYNARLGRALRRNGVPVLWCVAPQVWAWRPSRARPLAAVMDRLAVLLPFEVPLWQRVGVDAQYVGHPSFELAHDPAAPAPEPSGGPCVAVLPGSRRREVERLAPALIDAAAMLLRRGVAQRAVLLLSTSIPGALRKAVSSRGRSAGLAIREVRGLDGAAPYLSEFQVALCASGTACLEAALAGAAPVITYRTDALTYAFARRLVRTPHIGLPNVVLGRRAFPELLQRHAAPDAIAAAAERLLDHRDQTRDAVRELRAHLTPPSTLPFGERVAELMRPWLE